MVIKDEIKKTARHLADSVQTTYSELEKGLKDGAKIDTSKGSFFDEVSKINNYFDNSKSTKSDDDFIKDVISYAKLQTEATEHFFEDERNEATKILAKSEYWGDAKEMFYIIAMNYIGYISGNYRTFVNLLEVADETYPQFADIALKELIDERQNAETHEKEPVAVLRLYNLFLLFIQISEELRLKKKEPTKENILECNLKLFGKITADQQLENIKDEYKNIRLRAIDSILIPTDKINNRLTKIDAAQKKQQKFIFDVGNNKNQNATVLLDVDFTELAKVCPEVNRLSEFDKTVMTAVGSISKAGNSVTTSMRIAKMLRQTVNSDFLTKIDESLQKITAIQIAINNEAAAKKLGYDKLTYKGSMMPIERVTAVINGQVTDSAIHIFRTPPLIEYAIGCKQVITIATNLYTAIPAANSKYGLPIKNYILRRVISNTSYNKILLKTLFEECEITEKSARYNSKKTINNILEALKKNGVISDFELTADCILINSKEKEPKRKEK